MCLILHSIESFATDLNGHIIKLIPASVELWICTKFDTRAKQGLMIDCAWLFFPCIHVHWKLSSSIWDWWKQILIAKAADPGMLLSAQVSASALSWPYPRMIPTTILIASKKKKFYSLARQSEEQKNQNVMLCTHHSVLSHPERLTVPSQPTPHSKRLSPHSAWTQWLRSISTTLTKARLQSQQAVLLSCPTAQITWGGKKQPIISD